MRILRALRLRRRVIVRRRLLPRRWRRHPLVRVAVVAVVVVVALPTIARAVDTRQRWGATRRVYVARQRMEIGDVVDAGSVVEDSWPVAVVPDGAVDAPPVGRTVLAAIEPGEAVVSSRLAPDGLRGVAALVPEGSRAIAIPMSSAVVTLSVGDRVDLIAGFDASGSSGSSGAAAPAVVVARDAVVVATDKASVTVAVRDVDAARVAFAVVAGTVVPALRST